MYLFNHTFNINTPSLDSLDVRDLEGDLRERLGATKYYVKCQDVHGIQTIRAYVINFCIKQGPDLTAPESTQDILKNYGLGSNPQVLAEQQSQQLPWWLSWLSSLGGLGFTGTGIGGGNFGPAPVTSTTVPESPPINFRLELESRTQLIVDGRVLADIIKPYLGESLLQADGTQGSAALRVAI